jgi:hypothetical protein
MEYARFYKTDLHMQTPVDTAHWLGDPLRSPATPEDRRTAAEAYVRRCYEVGLEIVAITEHNFARTVAESLIPEIEAAAAALGDEFGYRLAIFPGFEVTAPIWARRAHDLLLRARHSACNRRREAYGVGAAAESQIRRKPRAAPSFTGERDA